MNQYFLLYKPFNMLTQFSSVAEGTPTLKELDFAFPIDAYPVGRLDKDSEGLLLLTNDKRLNDLLLSPKQQHEREYYVQVEGIPTAEALKKLQKGVQLSDYLTKPAKVKVLEEEPILPVRKPPIRFRKTVPTTWISISLNEGKNRQVRRMTAAVGLPTLRLVRWRIEKITLANMQPGDVVQMDAEMFFKKLNITQEQLADRERKTLEKLKTKAAFSRKTGYDPELKKKMKADKLAGKTKPISGSKKSFNKTAAPYKAIAKNASGFEERPAGDKKPAFKESNKSGAYKAFKKNASNSGNSNKRSPGKNFRSKL